MQSDKQYEQESRLLNANRDLSGENAELKVRVADERRLVYILSVLVLVFGLTSGALFYKVINQKTKYALSSADGRIIPFTMYNVPYKKVKDRIMFVENTAYRMNSLSWYDREEILSELYPRFYDSTFQDIIAGLEKHTFLNKLYMKEHKVSTSASFVEGAKLINSSVRNIKGFPSHVTGEEYEMMLLQKVRRDGVEVLSLKFTLNMVIVRVDTNQVPEGYKITQYKINAL